MNGAAGTPRPPDWSPFSRVNEMPRTVVCSLGIAIVANGRAAVAGLLRPQFLGAWQWAALAGACCVLLLTSVARPEYFRLREFRMPGVAISALSLLILAPLPGLVGRHDDRLPPYMTAVIAVGVLAFSVTILAAPRRPKQPPQVTMSSVYERMVPGAIVAVGLLILPIWLRTIGSAPIVQLLTGQASGVDISIARQNSLSGLAFTPLRLMIGALRNTYLMFATGWFVADVALLRHRTHGVPLGRRVAALVAMGTALMYAIVTTERAIIGQVGIVAVIATLVVLRKPLSTRLMMVLGAGAVAFPLIFGLLNSSGSVGAAIESVRRRVLFVPGDVMVEYFLSFPRRRPFLEGRSIPKVPRLFGQETFDLSGYVYDVAYGFDDRLEGSANASFIGVGWANYGTIGVIVWCVVAALALVWLERTLQTLPRRTHAALRGVAAVQAVLLTSADVSRTVLNVAPGFLDLLIGVAIVSVVHRSRAIRLVAARPSAATVAAQPG